MLCEGYVSIEALVLQYLLLRSGRAYCPVAAERVDEPILVGFVWENNLVDWLLLWMVVPL